MSAGDFVANSNFKVLVEWLTAEVRDLDFVNCLVCGAVWNGGFSAVAVVEMFRQTLVRF